MIKLKKFELYSYFKKVCVGVCMFVVVYVYVFNEKKIILVYLYIFRV